MRFCKAQQTSAWEGLSLPQAKLQFPEVYLIIAYDRKCASLCVSNTL